MWFTALLAVGIVGGGAALLFVPIWRDQRALRDGADRRIRAAEARAKRRAAGASSGPGEGDGFRVDVLEKLGEAIAEAIAEEPTSTRTSPAADSRDAGTSLAAFSDADDVDAVRTALRRARRHRFLAMVQFGQRG
jgi:hypothetical protein